MVQENVRSGRVVMVAVVAVLLAAFAVFEVVLMSAHHDVMLAQRDGARAELSVSQAVPVGSAVRVVDAARWPQPCATPYYVDGNGVRSVFVYDGTAVVPMPGALSWHLVDEKYNAWGLAVEGDGADPARDANGQLGWWLQVRGVWCGVGDPGVSEVSQVR